MGDVSLIVRADDIGSARAANEAILAACDAGTVKNVSVMVPGPAFAEAAENLRGRDDVLLGLHVTLNAEWVQPAARWGSVSPASQVPSLLEADTGFFTPTPGHLYERGFTLSEAVAEAEAQLTKARAAHLRIAYLDEHMGVGWLPGLRDELAKLARREGLMDAIALNPPSLPVALSGARDVSERAARVYRAVESAAPGTYLWLLHPARRTAETELFYTADGEPGQVAAGRELEYQLLTLPAFAEGLRERGVRIVGYDTLLK